MAVLGFHWHLCQEPVTAVSATSAREWFYFNSRGCQSRFLVMKWHTRAWGRWHGHKYFIAILCMCKWLIYLFSCLWNGRQWIIPSAPPFQSVVFVLAALSRMGRWCPWTCFCQFEIGLNCDLQVILLSLSVVTAFWMPRRGVCLCFRAVNNEWKGCVGSEGKQFSFCTGSGAFLKSQKSSELHGCSFHQLYAQDASRAWEEASVSQGDADLWKLHSPWGRAYCPSGSQQSSGRCWSSSPENTNVQMLCGLCSKQESHGALGG